MLHARDNDRKNIAGATTIAGEVRCTTFSAGIVTFSKDWHGTCITYREANRNEGGSSPLEPLQKAGGRNRFMQHRRRRTIFT
jgi:hypothetical protein